ncbi:hypothetical protein Zmor_002851 [Zophobas morio]|uniref:Uncharacterized protein n=1 Tax=Zophobas morio TaxID=2755281 RepID=A0AA38HLU3_9CUCU|nr:hypothetical protein Zmor_002851 [Zophobas morio]
MTDYKVYLSPNQIKKLQSCKDKRIDCNIRFDLTEKANKTIKLREKQIDEIKKCKKDKKKYCDIKFSPTQIGGFLPALIPAAIAVAKALGLGAAGYAGTKLAQKAFGDGLKKNKKKPKKPKKPNKSETYGQGIKLIGKGG